MRPVHWIAAAAALHHAIVGSTFGPGDAEALYIVYSRHLQGGYLEHPPLVALVIRTSTALFGGSIFAARLPAAVLFGATILLADRLARALGGSPRAGLIAAASLLCIPMFAAGSLAITPDAVAAPLVLGSLWATARAVDRPGVAAAALAGAVVGLAFLAKYTSLFLVPGLIVLALRRGASPLRLAVAALAALAVASPVVLWNAASGWPSLWHRLVWSQADAGPSLRNLGALVGGQLLYVGPPMLVALGRAVVSSRTSGSDGWRLPAQGALAGAVAICLVSRVAEPHWTATAILPLAIGLGIASDTPGFLGRGLARAAVIWSAGALVVLHLYVLTPLAPLSLPAGAYDPKVDIANELHGWPAVARAVRRARRPGDLVAAGHYTMCAQLEVSLGDPNVRCMTGEVDDWDLWGRGRLPDRAPTIFVSDERYPTVPRGARLVDVVRVRRGGREVRAFRLWRL
ncbi:MAG: glycosyltransferase family 39 protein [Deltaproteobacteria bacterium]|nr:glycosyltransferase family 39 protein [Deltaproteobacteria bacterium]